MASILILYASHFGQTRAIAGVLADELRREHTVELVDIRSTPLPPPDRFDVVVLGSRVEVGKHHAAIRDYLVQYRDELRRKPSAFFSVSMAASSPAATRDPNGYLAALFEDVGWTPTIKAAFAGGLPYRKYNWVLRFVMKRISRSAGHTTDTSRDHDFTDWKRVRELAQEIAALAAPQRDIATRL